MISLDEALEALIPAVPRPAPETVPLDAALGRTLARDVATDRDQPPTDRSAMDGFAVRAADTARPGATLEVVGEVAAGHAPALTVGPGQAARVFTGAVVPPGADAVVMVERTREDREAGTVVVDVAVEAGAHVRPRGQDRRRGDRVLRAGRPVDAAAIAALASVGAVRVEVGRRPRVAVLSTGDEVVAPAATPEPHQIRNSNSPMLVALAREAGVEARDAGTAGDERAALEAGIRAALAGTDLLLLSGGVSVGEYDLVRPALEALGARVLFHGVRIKPGKPILAARIDDTLVLGLPGNPVSACCGFVLFAGPALRTMQGREAWRTPRLGATLADDLRRRPGRRTFTPARLALGADGASVAPVRSTGSGDVLSLADADAFIETDEDCDGLSRGTLVPVVPLRAATPG